MGNEESGFSPYWALKFFGLSAVVYVLFVYFARPYARMLMYKWTFGDKVEIYFYPFIGFFAFFARSPNKSGQPIGDTLYRGFMRRNPNMKVLITNLGSRLYYFINDEDLIRRASLEYTHLHAKLLEVPFADLVFEKGLFSTQGDVWKRQRAFMAPLFSFDALSTRVPAITHSAHDLVARLREQPQARKSLLMTLATCTGDVISRTFFGDEVAKAQVYEGVPLSVTLKEVLTEMVLTQLEDPVTVVRGFLLGTFRHEKTPFWAYTRREKALHAKIARVREFVCGVIADRQAKFGASEEATKNDFLHVYLKHMHEARDGEERITHEEVLQQFMSIYMAGQDTTAHTLLVALYHLGQHQDVQETLRREARAVFGRATHGATLEKVKQLVEMSHFVNEVLRVSSPASSLIPRIANINHELGFLSIQKGDYIDVNILGNATSEKFFAKAESFDVSRWRSGDAEKARREHPFAFTPFFSGPRNCIGQHMSLLETKLILCEILLNLRVLPRENYELRMTAKVFYEPEDDYLAEFEEIPQVNQ